MNKKYYELIDETVYENQMDNGLKLFIIPKKGFKNVCNLYDAIRFT